MIGKLLILGAIGLSLVAGSFSLPVAPEELNNQVKKELPELIDPVMEPWSTKVRTIGPSYQSYFVDLANIETLDPKAKDAGASIISEDYIWVWLLLDSKGKAIGVAEAEKWEEDNTWDVVIGSDGDSSDMLEIANDSDKFIKFLDEKGIAVVNDIKRFRIEVLATDFIYVDSAQGQYIIQLSDQPSIEDRERLKTQLNWIFTNLEGGRVYPAAEALAEIIEWKVNSPNVGDKGYRLIGGYSSNSPGQTAVPVEKAEEMNPALIAKAKGASKKVADGRGLPLSQIMVGIIAFLFVFAAGVALRRRGAH